MTASPSALPASIDEFDPDVVYAWMRAIHSRKRAKHRDVLPAMRTLVLGARPTTRLETSRLMCDALHYLNYQHRAGRPLDETVFSEAAVNAYLDEHRGTHAWPRVQGSRVKRAAARWRNDPDPIVTARAARRAQPKRNARDRAVYLDSYRPRNVSGATWAPVLDTIRPVLLAAPTSMTNTALSRYLTALAALVSWWESLGEPVQLELMLREAALDKFSRARLLQGQDRHGVQTYRGNLRRLAEGLRTGRLKPGRSGLGLGRQKLQPTDDTTLRLALEHAAQQPAATVRRSYQAFLLIAAATPAPRQVLRTVRGTDIRRRADGHLMLTLGGISYPVLDEHAPALRRLAQECGEQYLVMPHLAEREAAVEACLEQLVGLPGQPGQHVYPRWSALRQRYILDRLDKSGVVALIATLGNNWLQITQAAIAAILADEPAADYATRRGDWLFEP